MAGVDGRTRVALTGFESGRELFGALAGLASVAFASTQLGLAALEQTFESLCRDASGDGAVDILSLLADPVTLAARCADQAVLLSRGPLWPSLGCFASEPGAQLLAAQWMEPRLGRELAAHLRRGDILLAVRALTPGQQRQATHILLTHGSHRVHTHDFTPASGAQSS